MKIVPNINKLIVVNSYISIGMKNKTFYFNFRGSFWGWIWPKFNLTSILYQCVRCPMKTIIKCMVQFLIYFSQLFRSNGGCLRTEHPPLNCNPHPQPWHPAWPHTTCWSKVILGKDGNSVGPVSISKFCSIASENPWFLKTPSVLLPFSLSGFF